MLLQKVLLNSPSTEKGQNLDIVIIIIDIIIAPALPMIEDFTPEIYPGTILMPDDVCKLVS